MAKVQLEFEGTGGLLDDLRAIGAGLREVGTQNAQVQSEIQVELRKSAAGALAFVQYMHQPFVQCGLGVVAAQLGGVVQAFAGVTLRHQVPGR